MTLRKLEIDTPQGSLNMEFSELTILTGNSGIGKSSILKLISKIFESIDKVYTKHESNKKISIKSILSIPAERAKVIKKRFSKIWNIDLNDWDNSVLISYKVDKEFCETIIKIPIIDEPILHTVYRGGNEILLRKPIEVEIKEYKNNIIELLKYVKNMPQTQLFPSYEEELNIALKLIENIVTSLKSVKIYRIGPYIDYSSCVDMRDLWSIYSDDYVGIHGENTLVVLARAFADGRLWPDLAKLLSYLEKIGISRVRCGIVNGKLSITYVGDEGLIICPELPCTIRTLITYYIQVLLSQKNSIILIDNFDFCMSEDTCKVLTGTFKQCIHKNVQVIAEVHNKDIAKILVEDVGFREIRIENKIPTLIKYV